MRGVESLHDWQIRARTAGTHRNLSGWRKQSIETMRGVVDDLVIASRPLVPNKDSLIKAVDAAYPFGERKHHPYKAWLKERAIFLDAVSGDRLTPDELGALEVAIDLIELKREDEAKELVDREAPRRHARPCPVCGVGRNKPCREPDQTTYGEWSMLSPKMTNRIVPHLARYQPAEETRDEHEHDDGK